MQIEAETSEILEEYYRLEESFLAKPCDEENKWMIQ